jgi:kynurenine formamidase
MYLNPNYLCRSVESGSVAYQDLTQTVQSGMPVFPGDPEVELSEHATVPADGYRVHSLYCGSHSGTHVDAPSHVVADGETLDAFSVERFVLDAVLIDCTECDSREPIGPERLPATEADLLVVQTGWSDHWNDRTYRDHPFLTPAAAEFCVEQRYDIAVDALNPDPTPTDRAKPGEPSGFPVHHQLLSEQLLIFENLTNLSGLPERFEFLAFPMKLTEGDGAPVRAVAQY